jgi:hypothetical protein
MKRWILFLLAILPIWIIHCTPTYDMMVKDPGDRACLDSIKMQPLEFDMNKEESTDAWGRAQSFVAQYSSMKIQIATDYVIETYNPVSRSTLVAFGYHITKTPIGGSRVRVMVKCSSDNMFAGDMARVNAQILAYFIQTGELRCPKFIKK